MHEEVLRQPPAPYQAVLGLTFMHGARRRLRSKLSEKLKGATRIECSTIDSFALETVRRFRRHLGLCGFITVDHSDGDLADWVHVAGVHRAPFHSIRRAAAALLERRETQIAIRAAYPLVIVDEFQDCDHDLLEVVKRLASFTSVFVAADEFQALSATADPAAIEWLQQEFTVTALTRSERTSVDALLRTAWALRNGAPDPNGVDIVICGQAQRAAFRIAALHQWGERWLRRETVVLSPASPGTSAFVRSTLEQLRGVVSQKYNLGNCPFRWLGSHRDEDENLKKRLPTEEVSAQALRRACSDPFVAEVYRQTAFRCGLTGATFAGPTDVREVADQVLAALRAHSPAFDSGGRVAMTIHSAKNREFENVVVLWPFSVPKDKLSQRRLLYNAITRARRRAIILVEGPEQRVIGDGVLSLIWSAERADAEKKRKAQRAKTKGKRKRASS